MVTKAQQIGPLSRQIRRIHIFTAQLSEFHSHHIQVHQILSSSQSFPSKMCPNSLFYQNNICVSGVVNASNLNRTLYSKVEGGGFQSLPLIGASHCHSRSEKSLVTPTAIFEVYHTAVMRRNLELVLLQGEGGSNYTTLSGEQRWLSDCLFRFDSNNQHFPKATFRMLIR